MKCTNRAILYLSFFGVVSCMFQACNSPENNESKFQTEKATGTDADHDAANQLSLNDGAKWKADSSTNKNVSDLYNVIADANPVVVEDYQKTGKAVQNGIDKLVSECRMQGPDHDALHHWLEPLMQENKKLSEVKTTEEGKESFGMIRKRFENYSDYFE